VLKFEALPSRQSDAFCIGCRGWGRELPAEINRRLRPLEEATGKRVCEPPPTLLIGRHGRDLPAFALEGEHFSGRLLRVRLPSDKTHGPFTSWAIGVAS